MTPTGEGEQSLFRKTALESMGGRNRLNTLSPLISPQLWIVTASLACLLAAVVAWSFLGRIPVTVLGGGVFVRGERLDTVNAPIDGLIREMRKHDGDRVKAGECIAIIAPSASSNESTEVIASADGTVVSIEAEDWDFLSKGQTVAVIATGNDAPICIAFVPLAESQRIHRGMAARATFDHGASFGDAQILGRVSTIDRFIIGPDQMFGRVPSQAVGAAIRERFGTVAALVIACDSDAQGHAGLRWITPPTGAAELSSGTPCDIEITVGQVRPIALILPGLGSVDGSSP